MARNVSHKAVSKKWQRILRVIPGYDPVATAPPDHWFDEYAAQQSLDFFAECVTHTKGELAGQNIRLEPWQVAIIANLFGWKCKDSRGRTVRRYTEAYIEVARKNGKTTLSSGIANKCLFADGERGGEVYCAAGEQKQAGILFRIAKRMVLNDDWMSLRAKLFQASIEDTESDSFFRAISSAADSAHGFNPHCAVIDELHVQPSRDLFDALMTGMGSRLQPLMVSITTAGYDRNSICWEKHDYAGKVQDGIIDDPRFLPAVYSVPDNADWTDEAAWAEANPNLGVSVSIDYLRRECEKAKESPTYQNTFRRLHLNQWTEQDVRFISMDKWDACQADVVIDHGAECYAGLDLASTTDLAALTLVFPDGDSNFQVLPFYFAPEEGARRRERTDRVPYLTWAGEGHIELTPGNVVDYDRIRERVKELGERYNIREIAIDRWNSTQLQTQLMGDGFNVVQFGQGYASMSAPTKKLEELVLSERIVHDGNPVLRWNVSNAAAEMDAAGNIKLSKKKSTEKIDGAIAMVMGLGRAMLRDTSTSIYSQGASILL